MTARGKQPARVDKRFTPEMDRRLVWVIAAASWAGLVGLVLGSLILRG